MINKIKEIDGIIKTKAFPSSQSIINLTQQNRLELQ
jgi:hypothetical protein